MPVSSKQLPSWPSPLTELARSKAWHTELAEPFGNMGQNWDGVEVSLQLKVKVPFEADGWW